MLGARGSLGKNLPRGGAAGGKACGRSIFEDYQSRKGASVAINKTYSNLVIGFEQRSAKM